MHNGYGRQACMNDMGGCACCVMIRALSAHAYRKRVSWRCAAEYQASARTSQSPQRCDVMVACDPGYQTQRTGARCGSMPYYGRIPGVTEALLNALAFTHPPPPRESQVCTHIWYVCKSVRVSVCDCVTHSVAVVASLAISLASSPLPSACPVGAVKVSVPPSGRATAPSPSPLQRRRSRRHRRHRPRVYHLDGHFPSNT